MTTDSPENDMTMREALRLAGAKLPKDVSLRIENAYLGFEKARMLLPIDREMASFRAITAEEEAATALIKSLQVRGYPGAKKLRPYRHTHKAAVGPFLEAARVSLSERTSISINVTVDWHEPSITVALPLSQFGISLPGKENLQIQLVEPLGVIAKKGDGHPADYFQDGIKAVVEAADHPDIGRMIAVEANLRNKLLYASDSSLPESRLTEEGIERRQARADLAIGLAIAVMQVRTPQTFATQALQAFLRCIDRNADEQFTYGEGRPIDVEVGVPDEGPVSPEVRETKRAE